MTTAVLPLIGSFIRRNNRRGVSNPLPQNQGVSIEDLLPQDPWGRTADQAVFAVEGEADSGSTTSENMPFWTFNIAMAERFPAAIEGDVTIRVQMGSFDETFEVAATTFDPDTSQTRANTAGGWQPSFLSYRWPITQALFDTLPNPSGGTQFDFEFTVTFNDGKTPAPTATLTVGAATASDTSPDVGDTVTLTCPTPGGTATGDTTYQWQEFDGTAWANIAGATSQTYQATRSSAGALTARCLVGRGGLMVASGQVVVTWSVAVVTPTVTVGNITTSDATPEVGDRVTLTCPTPGGTATGDATYQWQELINSVWVDLLGETARTYSPLSNTATRRTFRCGVTRQGVTTYSPNFEVQWAAAAATRVTAVAGSDVEVASGGSVAIGGTDTITNGAGATTIAWSRVSGTGGSLSSTGAASPTFAAPTLASGDPNRVIVWRKTVTNNGVTDTDDVEITVTAPDATPTTPADTVAPVVEDTPTVNGRTLTIIYNEALDENSTPAVGDYNVQVAGSRRTVASVTVSGRTVTLALTSPVENGETVSLSYTAGTNPVRDEAGNDASNLSNQGATNQTPRPGSNLRAAAGGPPSARVGTRPQYFVTVTGGAGDISQQWQFRYGTSGGWTNGGTAANYQPAAIPNTRAGQTLQVRCNVDRGTESVTSNIVSTTIQARATTIDVRGGDWPDAGALQIQPAGFQAPVTLPTAVDMASEVDQSGEWHVDEHGNATRGFVSAIEALLTRIIANEMGISAQAQRTTTLEARINDPTGRGGVATLAVDRLAFQAPSDALAAVVARLARPGVALRAGSIGSEGNFAVQTITRDGNKFIVALSPGATYDWPDSGSINIVPAGYSETTPLQPTTRVASAAAVDMGSEWHIEEGTFIPALAQAQQILEARMDLVEAVDGPTTLAGLARWLVKTRVGDRIGGVGLYNDGSTVEFIVNADRFAIVPPGWTGGDTDKRIPFAVANGRVYIDVAAIRDASITSLKAANAFLTNLTAVHGTLAFARIGQGNIFDLAIGNQIVSDDYVAGRSGYRLNRAGVEFAAGVLGDLRSVNYDASVARASRVGWFLGSDGSAEFAAASIRGRLTAQQIDTTGLTVAADIPNDFITEAMIRSGAVTAVKIADGAVTANKVAAGSITADKLAAGVLTVGTNTQWLFASGAPSASTGVVGNFYQNVSNGDVYEKTGTRTWTLRGNVISGLNMRVTALEGRPRIADVLWDGSQQTNNGAIALSWTASDGDTIDQYDSFLITAGNANLGDENRSYSMFGITRDRISASGTSGWHRVGMVWAARSADDARVRIWGSGRTLNFQGDSGHAEIRQIIGFKNPGSSGGGGTITPPQTTTDTDTVYRRGTTTPSRPTGGTTTENHAPSGWSRSRLSPTATLNVYACQRTRTFTDGSFTSATAWSAPFLFQGNTGPTVTAPRFAPSTSGFTASGTTLRWGSVLGATSYDVYYGASTTSTAPTSSTSADGTTTSTSITRSWVQRGRSFWVRARNSAGAGPWSGRFIYPSLTQTIPRLTGVSIASDGEITSTGTSDPYYAEFEYDDNSRFSSPGVVFDPFRSTTHSATVPSSARRGTVYVRGRLTAGARGGGPVGAWSLTASRSFTALTWRRTRTLYRRGTSTPSRPTSTAYGAYGGVTGWQTSNPGATSTQNVYAVTLTQTGSGSSTPSSSTHTGNTWSSVTLATRRTGNVGPSLRTGFVNRDGTIPSGFTGDFRRNNALFALARISTTLADDWGVIFRYPGWFAWDNTWDGRANSNQDVYWRFSRNFSRGAEASRIPDNALVQARTYRRSGSYSSAQDRWDSADAGPVLRITTINGTRRT